jgi:RNA polymerase sigma-70 factor (ECF subfamily)
MEASEAEGVDPLLGRVAAGDPAALEQLLARERPFMRRVVEVRLDGRLRARLDPSDVVQEAQLEVARRLPDYLGRRPMPFRLWLRQTTFETVLRLHRFHLAAECRAVIREFPLPEDSSAALGRQLLARGAGPIEHLVDQELSLRVREGMTRLGADDREVLFLRVFEDLPNADVAAVLGIEPAAASQRFGRALVRLRRLLIERDRGGAPDE